MTGGLVPPPTASHWRARRIPLGADDRSALVQSTYVVRCKFPLTNQSRHISFRRLWLKSRRNGSPFDGTIMTLTIQAQPDPTVDSWSEDGSDNNAKTQTMATVDVAELNSGELFGDGEDERTKALSSAYELRPRFTGRTKALATLTETFAQTCQQQQLGYVVVQGESGIGKTRLINEFCSVARSAAPAAVLMSGRADDAGTAYGAIARALAGRFSILVTDSHAEAGEKIVAGVSEVVAPARVPEVAHLLAHLMRYSFPDSPIVTPLVESPQRLESRTFMAMRRFLAAEAQRHPVVLIVENLDVCGAETINLVHYLAAGAQQQRLMVLGTTSEPLLERYPIFEQGDISPLRIELGPLTPGEAESLFRELCRPLDHVPQRLVDHVRSCIDSPRSIHELVRWLLETGCIARGAQRQWRLDADKAATLQLPQTYQALLEARLAVMDPHDRRTLEIASVIGETCWFDALVSVDRSSQAGGTDPDGPTLAQIAALGDMSRLKTSTAVNKLIEHEWLAEIRLPSISGERELRFAYPVLWQLVYSNVPDDIKRKFHSTVAQWLELHPDGRGPSTQEEVARHLELAGQSQDAALRYRRAAEAARSQYANERAIALFDRALACVGSNDVASRIRLWHDLGSVYELVGNFEGALGAFERVLRLSWVVASKTKAAVAFNKMGRVWRRKGDLKLAVEYLNRGLELFRAAGDSRGVASSYDDLGRAMHMLGRYDEAYQRITEGLALRGQSGDKRSIAASLSNLGSVQQERGQYDAAFNCHKEALEMRRAAGDRWGQVASQNNLAALAFETNDYGSARAGWVTALAAAESIGALPLTALILTNMGELALAESKPEEARSRLENALEIIEDIEDRHLETEACRHMCTLQTQLGRLDLALRYGTRALNVARQTGLAEREALAQISMGEVYSASLYDSTVTQSDVPPAKVAFANAVDIARGIGNDATLGRALLSHGRYLAEQGDVPGGRDLLRDALTVFARLGLARQAQDVERVLSSL
jgi:tetratricopeptide (TPR) repeat protein